MLPITLQCPRHVTTQKGPTPNVSNGKVRNPDLAQCSFSLMSRDGKGLPQVTQQVSGRTGQLGGRWLLEAQAVGSRCLAPVLGCDSH